MKATMADFEIVSITETPLMDVYKVRVKADGNKPAEEPKE